MRYLTLAADYTQSALRDDYAGCVLPEEVGLPDELSIRIRDWNVRYREIIPLDEKQRAEDPAAELIEALDREGLALVRDIVAAYPGLKLRDSAKDNCGMCHDAPQLRDRGFRSTVESYRCYSDETRYRRAGGGCAMRAGR